MRFLSQQGRQKGDKTRQVTTTDVSFTKGKLMFPCFKEKSVKRWLEVAFDLMRGLKVAQIAKTSRIYTILRAQRVPTRGILGPSKGPAGQWYLRVSACFARKMSVLCVLAFDWQSEMVHLR